MKPSLRDSLVSPQDGAPLSWDVDERGCGFLRSGVETAVPVRNSIPRFTSEEGFVESFGFQWNRFNVRRKEEDEATFLVKTGVPLADLTGRRVLDAGCGGGRYTRVAAEHGAEIVGVDRSNAVEKAREVTAGLPNVLLVQADLNRLPFRPGEFDLVFSIGVLHHSPDARAAFASVASMVRPGGRLSVWLYRRNSWIQEQINNLARAAALRASRRTLLAACRIGAAVGGVPLLGPAFSKVLNVSTHRDPELRFCDTFDWYSPRHQSHHTVEELQEWFAAEHFAEISELPPAKSGRMYQALFRRGFIPGSGVNLTGVRR